MCCDEIIILLSSFPMLSAVETAKGIDTGVASTRIALTKLQRLGEVQQYKGNMIKDDLKGKKRQSLWSVI